MTWTTRPRSELGKGLAGIVAGSGQQVVLLHGVGLRAEACALQIDALLEDYRVLAIDLPGHGESRMLGAGADLRAYTQAVLGAFDGTAVLVGHSMGAMIALDAACREPERVSGVVALNAVFERSPEAAKAVQKRAASLDGVTVADPTATLQRWFGDDANPERSACETWLTSIAPAAYKAAYTVFAQSAGPDRSALARMRCPALFITGSEEPNSTPDMSRAMAHLAPVGDAVVIEEAAHMMPMTHAVEVNRAIQDFLQKVPA